MSLQARHRAHLGLLLSEVAEPRTLTTYESWWASTLLAGLGHDAQEQVEVRMTQLGPELALDSDRGLVVLRPCLGGTEVTVTTGGGETSTRQYDGLGDAATFLHAYALTARSARLAAAIA